MSYLNYATRTQRVKYPNISWLKFMTSSHFHWTLYIFFWLNLNVIKSEWENELFTDIWNGKKYFCKSILLYICYKILFLDTFFFWDLIKLFLRWIALFSFRNYFCSLLTRKALQSPPDQLQFSLVIESQHMWSVSSGSIYLFVMFFISWRFFLKIVCSSLTCYLFSNII